MRSQAQSRRILNGVMKSPSPDIANINNIKNTESPISDVKKYLERTTQSRSPRISDISHSARYSHNNIEVEMLRTIIQEFEKRNYEQGKKILEFEQKIEKMERERGNEWKREILGEKAIIDKGKGICEKEKEMEERVHKLLNENIRLGGLLKDKEAKFQTLNKEFQIVKNRIETLQLIQISENQDKPVPIDQSLPIREVKYEELVVGIKNDYQLNIEPEMRKYESEIENKFLEMFEKLKKIEENQIEIEKQISKRNKMTPPTKHKSSSYSTCANDFNSHQQGNTCIEAPDHIKPFSSIGGMNFIRDTETSFHGIPESLKRSEEIIRNLEVRIERLDKENFDQRNKILSLEEELKISRENERSNFNMKSNESVENYIRKIKELEHEIDIKNMSLFTIQRELNSVENDNNYMKEKISREIFEFENERNINKKVLEQQKQKYMLLNESYSKLMEEFHEIEVKISSKEVEIEARRAGLDEEKEEINSKLKGEMRSELENREENIKRYYEDILKNKDRVIGEQLQEYLKMLQSIGRDIEEENIEEVIDDCELVMNDKISIDKQIMYIKEENERIINEFKKQFIEQESRIIELEKHNGELHTEINELKKQKIKLKSAMFDFEEFKPLMNTRKEKTGVTSKFDSGCKLKGCLKETVRRIDEIEHKVQDSIFLDYKCADGLRLYKEFFLICVFVFLKKMGL